MRQRKKNTNKMCLRQHVSKLFQQITLNDLKQTKKVVLSKKTGNYIRSHPLRNTDSWCCRCVEQFLTLANGFTVSVEHWEY